MSTQIQKNGHKHIIIHDGEVYVIRLKSVQDMVRREQHLVHLHSELGRAEPDFLKRSWHFKLRENARARMEGWQSCL